MSKKQLSRFVDESNGSVAVFAAVMSVALIGAVGVGVDTYSAQSTDTALRHIVDLSCDRISNADIASFPTAGDTNTMAEKFASVTKTQTAAKNASVSITPPPDPYALTGQVTVSASETFNPTFTSVLGAKPFTMKKSATCERRTTLPPKIGTNPKCNVAAAFIDVSRKNSLVVNDLAQYASSENIGSGKLNYIYTVVDKDNNITTRKFFSDDTVVDPAKLPNDGKDQIMYVQVMNSDGSIPVLEKQCTVQPPTTPVVPIVPTNPPPTLPVCNNSPSDPVGLMDSAGDLSGRITAWGAWKTTSFSNYTLTPAFKDVVPGITSVITVKSKITGEELLVPLSSNFSKLDQSDTDVIAATAEIGIDPESAFLIAMMAPTDSDPNQIYNHEAREKYLKYGYILDRIASGSSGLWQEGGATAHSCMYSVSPIVIDLTNKGLIETTSMSTAQYGNRAKLGKTVKFDISNTGKPLTMEWLTDSGQGLLVDNRDGNAAKDMNGNRLFGNTAQHPNGYSKLAALFKTDANGVIVGDGLKGLAVWVDNGDGVVQSGEIKSLSELGITAISTRMESVKDAKGDTLMRSYVIRNNAHVMSEDVWFGAVK